MEQSKKNKSPNRAWRTASRGGEISLLVIIAVLLGLLGAFVFTIRCAWEAGAL